LLQTLRRVLPGITCKRARKVQHFTTNTPYPSKGILTIIVAWQPKLEDAKAPLDLDLKECSLPTDVSGLSRMPGETLPDLPTLPLPGGRPTPATAPMAIDQRQRTA